MSDHEQFKADMEAAGIHWQEYTGRNFWKGPAITISDPADYQDVVRLTKVKLQTDSLGRGMVVYPAAYAKGDA